MQRGLKEDPSQAKAKLLRWEGKGLRVGLRSGKQPAWPGREIGKEATEMKQGLAGTKGM